MSSDNLTNILVSANLEHLLPGLNSLGIQGYSSLAQLRSENYSRVGAISKRDQEQLSELIAYLRSELNIQSDSPGNNYNVSIGNQQDSDLLEEGSFGSLSDPDPYPESDYRSDSYSNDYNENMYETEWEIEGDIPSEDEVDPQWNSMQLRINSGVDPDEQKPQRIIREGTSTKNALLNAYGMPTNKNTTNRSSSNYKPMQSSPPISQSPGGKISVCVRKRPLSKSELQRGEADIIETGVGMLSVHENKKKVDLTKYIEEHRFYFDQVFGQNDDNSIVYQKSVSPLVTQIFNGGNATCFAYGQTGSGKTYTMLDSNEGLYILAGQDIFQRLKNPEYKGTQVVVVFYEIYLTDVYDLLNDRKRLHVREKANHNVCIKDIAEVSITSVNDLYSVFEYGNKNRRIGSTGANSESSRSHAVMQIQLRRPKGTNPIGHTVGKLSFIDLAGNERGADRGDSQKDSTVRREGSEINKSLLALKECIRALDMGKSHQPFRQSRLTMVLRDSFIGNSLCCMIATVAPNSSNCDHTLNTLRYADRVKSIRGKSHSQGSAKSSPRHSNGSKNIPNKKLLSLPVAKSPLKLPRQVSGLNMNVIPRKPQFAPRKSMGTISNEKPEKRRSTEIGLGPSQNFISRDKQDPSSFNNMRPVKSTVTFNPSISLAKKNSSESFLKIPTNPKFSQKSLNNPEISRIPKTASKFSTGSSPKSPKNIGLKNFGGTQIEKRRLYSSEKIDDILKPNVNRSIDLDNSNPFKNKLVNQKSQQSPLNIRNPEKISIQGLNNANINQDTSVRVDNTSPTSNYSSSVSSINHRNISSDEFKGKLSSKFSDPKKPGSENPNAIMFRDWAMSSKNKKTHYSKLNDSVNDFNKLNLNSANSDRKSFEEDNYNEYRQISTNPLDLYSNQHQDYKKDDLDLDFDKLNDFSSGRYSGTEKTASINEKIMDSVGKFIKLHAQHVQFLKSACEEEILALSDYVSFMEKTSSRISDSNLSRYDKKLSETGVSHINDPEFIKTVASLKDLFISEELNESKAYRVDRIDSQNGSSIEVSRDGVIASFKSVDDAKTHFASEYAAQLDFILEAEIEEITGMRMELKNLISNNLK
ncbi:Kinesin-like protein KIF24 [Smittium mucronatum]|uniref:Kinesin-like protein KIF24 n=1 Tax=Smittium mucronatum TaxID=133383 RepID=A0A1R0H218_9FUNG|nr:Kinesin-like protein KIF24 [Smittium mucronatum]